jgi:hypothetical protein
MKWFTTNLLWYLMLGELSSTFSDVDVARVPRQRFTRLRRADKPRQGGRLGSLSQERFLGSNPNRKPARGKPVAGFPESSLTFIRHGLPL